MSLSKGESIPHQLCFKGLFILRGKTYIHHKPSGREPSRWSRSREQEPEPRGQAELAALLLKRNIPRPSGLVFQRLLADGAEGAPAALWARASATIG